MKQRAICAGVLLCLLASWQVRCGGTGAAFVFDRVDKVRGEAIFKPMYTPTIGMQLKSGPRRLQHGDIVICHEGLETHRVTEKSDGGEIDVTEFTLTCEQQVFVVKSIHFESN
jgi:hypothetical protein